MDNGNGLIQFFLNNGRMHEEQARQVAAAFEPRSFDKNSFFLREGRVSHEYLILESGCMRSFSISPDGTEVTTAFWTGPQPVFEVSSFFMRVPSQENIQALTTCEGSVITFEKLNQLFHHMPQFRELGRSILVKGFAAFKTRSLSMITQKAEERYATLLQNNPEIFRYASLKYIASYLGITDSSLSRIRKEMSRH